MKIVFLDCAIINPGDIPWDELNELCQFSFYERSTPEEALERAADADGIIIDGFSVDRKFIESIPGLKYIGIAATGYNHVDLEAAEEYGVTVCNVPAYSTEAVAQHAIALLLSLTNQIATYNEAIVDGQWQRSKDYTFIKSPITLLDGKSMGIVGYGNIGRRTAAIAEALGMTVYSYSKEPEKAVTADVVSLHCPLFRENIKMVDREFISRMKDGAILINTARGGLVDEEALAEALKSGKLAGAGLDVLSEEPPSENNKLVGLPNCYITPHIAFIPIETRKRVVEVCTENIRAYIDGSVKNRIV